MCRYSEGAGHYTQVVWAETEEVGCGFVYYTVSICQGFHDNILFNQ